MSRDSWEGRSSWLETPISRIARRRWPEVPLEARAERSAIWRSRSVVRVRVVADLQSRLKAASLHPLNPLAPPGRRLERIREILCLVHDLAVAEFHNTHCVCRSPLIGDCVFRDPEVAFTQNSPDVKTLRLAWVTT